VQLEVHGGLLHDRLGRLIDGNRDGQPGGDAIAVLNRTGVAISAMARAAGHVGPLHAAAVDAVLEQRARTPW
jgi:hypothetical protein